MSATDFDFLMQDVDGDAPCGPDLEYDPDFVALELEVVGKPEVQYGGTITAAVPPEWKTVDRAARALLLHSRDLRLAVHLTRANLALHDIDGLAAGLRLIEWLLVEQWDGVHPLLDAADDLDPTLRINSLATLTDRATVLRELKEASLVVLPVLGPVSLRMLEIATGELPVAAGVEKITMASIELSLRDADAAVMTAARAAIASACDAAAGIEAALERHVGASQSLNLDGLTRLLKRGRDFLGAEPEVVVEEAEAAAETEQAGAVGAAAGAAGPRVVPFSGDITNRADVLRVLDKLLVYYDKYEPSSPLPMLLLRAKGLASKTFMEILEDLAPDGIPQASLFRGKDGAPGS